MNQLTAWRTPLSLWSALTLLCASANGLPVITDVVETGGDNEPTDTILAKWTGITWNRTVANEPTTGAVGTPFTLGFFGEEVPAFVDRNHEWTGATPTLLIPRYLLGGEYIMSGNDNRDNPSYRLDVTISQKSFVYMLVDDRLGDGSNANPPNHPDWQLTRTGSATPDMEWIPLEGWLPVKTGHNRHGNPDWPDHIGVDEGADGAGPGQGVNQWSSIYLKIMNAGTFAIKQPDNNGQNMYGAVVVPYPKKPIVTGSSGNLFGVTFTILDGSDTQVKNGSVTLTLDGAAVTPQVSKAADITTVRWTATPQLASQSTHTAVLAFQDTGSPAVDISDTLTFTVEYYATLAAEDALPAGSVDLSSSGFVARIVQARDTARWPNNTLPNNTAVRELQLAGWLTDPTTGNPLVNYVVPGTGPGGTYTVPLINLNQDPTAEIGNFQSTSTPSFPDAAIPGIPGTDPESPANNDDIVGEFVGLLELKKGLQRLAVNSDDGFRLFAGRDPRSTTAKLLGEFNGGRGSADSAFYVDVMADGIYPVRLIWYEGNGGANLEFLSIDYLATPQTKILINDRANPKGIKAYSNLSVPAPPYATVWPLPGAANVWPGAVIRARVVDQGTAVAGGSIKLLVNGTAVTPTINKSGAITSVTYDPPGILDSEATYNVELQFSDTSSPANNVSQPWQFTVMNHASLPVLQPAFAVPSSQLDLNSSGFTVDVYQMSDSAGTIVARTGFADNNSTAAAERQLARGYIDPVTSQPYINGAYPGFDPDGRHVLEVVNWNQTAPANAGGFTQGADPALLNLNWIDAEIPGIYAGDTAYQNWIVAEAIAYLELKAGIYRLGVNSDDGFKVSAAADFRDLMPVTLGEVSGGRGVSGTIPQTSFDFIVQQDGIYPVRLLWWEGTGGASVEFYSMDPEAISATLINDRNYPTRIKAYRVYRGPARPYLKTVKPLIGETAVPTDTTIEAVVANLGANPVELFLDGAKVTHTLTTSGTDSTIRYTPPSPLPPGSDHTVRIVYGGISNSWSFTVGKGPKVLLVVVSSGALGPGDAALVDRLTAFGFDTVVVGDSASQTSDANNAVLVITSSTVGSGNVGDKFRNVAVPVVNWEQALQDNYLMTWDTGADRGTTGGQTDVVIATPGHPLAAGLAAGVHTVSTMPDAFSWGMPGPTATVVATLNDGSLNPCIYGYEKGAFLVDGTTRAPERRVMVFLGDPTYSTLTPAGVKLIDAALGWAMNRTLVIQEDTKFNPPVLQGGNVTISWTGPGTLQHADAVTGPWTDAVNQNNPQTTAAAGPAKFFRIKR